LTNYRAWRYGVKILLDMRIDSDKRRSWAGFGLVLPALTTSFNGLSDRCRSRRGENA
jgi:hypothetical protein